MASQDKANARGGSKAKYTPVPDARLTLSFKPLPAPGLDHVDDEHFERDFLEEILARDPCNEEALVALGHAYTRMGDYEKGLAIDRRLVRLRPSDPTAFYNLACSHALLRQLDEAFAALERAVALGYRDLPHMLTDPDLSNLRQDSRFRLLIGRLAKRLSSNS